MYKNQNEARENWIPAESKILYDDNDTILFIHKSRLYLMQFERFMGSWYVHIRFCRDLDALTCCHAEKNVRQGELRLLSACSAF